MQSIENILNKYCCKTPSIVELSKDIANLKNQHLAIKDHILAKMQNSGNQGYQRQKIDSIVPSKIEAVGMLWNNSSAIHFHDNFEALILVCSGSLLDIQYQIKAQILVCTGVKLVQAGEYMFENKELIHQIVPLSNEDNKVCSLHFYIPPLESLEGMRVIDVSKKQIVTLSKQAKSAVIPIAKEEVLSIKKNAFKQTNFTIAKGLIKALD